MGLLTVGKALTAEETARVSQYIREHGINQFLSTWNRVKDVTNDELKFGDEVECGIFAVDRTLKTVKLSVRSTELLAVLEEKERAMLHQSEGSTWHPEFGAWMIESTPSRPYTHYASDLLRVERNMTLRRRRLLAALAENEIAPMVTCFPLLGVGDFIAQPKTFEAPHSKSSYIPDYIVNPHPRFAALATNIRERRGAKVDIRVPLFHDQNTPEFLRLQREMEFKVGRSIEAAADYAAGLPAGYEVEIDTDIHMDAMGFGMGMCCLQVTFQARDIDESRYMYDQLAVLAPIMLAMTAATPLFKGRVSDQDVRWNVIAQSVDDRTKAERRGAPPPAGVPDFELTGKDIKPGAAGDAVQRIPKSRYDSVSTYIYHCKGDSLCRRTFAVYNDIPCPIDPLVKARLRSAGLDENLAHHLAHLFTRDPLVVFEGAVELDDEVSVEHFENIQSTNWQTCRWKPPPPRLKPDDPYIGWRTEFRSMEVQLTDFENAAYVVFVVLLTRVVLAFDLALYIPLSKVDENMSRAHIRDAARSQKFFFRKHMAPPEEARASQSSSTPCSPVSTESSYMDTNGFLPSEDSYEEMTMDEIFNGKEAYHVGLIPLVYAYLDYINVDPETFQRIDQYLQFISKKAKGEIVTTATWIRSFVATHPAYKKDSLISPEIACDLMCACKDIGEGINSCPEILGDVVIDRVRPEDAYGQILAGRLSSEERSHLIRRLADRALFKRPDHVARGTYGKMSVTGEAQTTTRAKS